MPCIAGWYATCKQQMACNIHEGNSLHDSCNEIVSKWNYTDKSMTSDSVHIENQHRLRVIGH